MRTTPNTTPGDEAVTDEADPEDAVLREWASGLMEFARMLSPDVVDPEFEQLLAQEREIDETIPEAEWVFAPGDEVLIDVGVGGSWSWREPTRAEVVAGPDDGGLMCVRVLEQHGGVPPGRMIIIGAARLTKDWPTIAAPPAPLKVGERALDYAGHPGTVILALTDADGDVVVMCDDGRYSWAQPDGRLEAA